MDKAPMEPLQTYTVSDVVKILQSSQPTVLKLLKEGKLKGIKIGSSWRISGENLRAFINGDQ